MHLRYVTMKVLNSYEKSIFNMRLFSYKKIRNSDSYMYEVSIIPVSVAPFIAIIAKHVHTTNRHFMLATIIKSIRFRVPITGKSSTIFIMLYRIWDAITAISIQIINDIPRIAHSVICFDICS